MPDMAISHERLQELDIKSKMARCEFDHDRNCINTPMKDIFDRNVGWMKQ